MGGELEAKPPFPGPLEGERSEPGPLGNWLAQSWFSCNVCASAREASPLSFILKTWNNGQETPWHRDRPWPEPD